MSDSVPHKFKVGATVQFHPSARDHYAARGMYVVTKQLPENNGELEYRIKNPNEPHQRIARESELSPP
jgi:hypothetical protein